jgi:hypothetical protein
VSVTTDINDVVTGAIYELEQEFGLTVKPDGSGGAFVTVLGGDLGERWAPRIVDIAFNVASNYPFAAIYPFYPPSVLERCDAGNWPSALQRVEWRGGQVTQISLRANRWDPNVDTARGAVIQVLHWFRERA